MQRTNRVLLLLLIALGIAHPAHADNPYGPNSWSSHLLDQVRVHEQQRDQFERVLTATRRVSSANHEPYARTDFAAAAKRLVVDAYVASLAQDPEQRRVLGIAIAQVFEAYEKQARKNNVAGALAFAIAAAITVDRSIEMTADQREELALAVNDYLAKQPAFIHATATQRQELYETCVVAGGMIVMFAAAGKQGDGTSAKAAKLLAAQVLTTIGMTSTQH